MLRLAWARERIHGALFGLESHAIAPLAIVSSVVAVVQSLQSAGLFRVFQLAPPGQRLQMPRWQFACRPSDLVGVGRSPQVLASMRMVWSGELGFLLASSEDLQAYLHKLVRPGDSSCHTVSLLEIKTFMESIERACTVNDLKKLKEAGISIYKAKVAAGNTIVILAGWFALVTALGGQPVSGVRQAFLPKSVANYRALKSAVQALDVGDGLTKALVATLDELAAEEWMVGA